MFLPILYLNSWPNFCLTLDEFNLKWFSFDIDSIKREPADLIEFYFIFLIGYYAQINILDSTHYKISHAEALMAFYVFPQLWGLSLFPMKYVSIF